MAKFSEDREGYLTAQKLLSRLVKELPVLELNPKEHNINYLPEEKVYFFAKEYMSLFSPAKRFSIRDYKVINYDKPAVNLIFNTKHKYFLKKKVSNSVIKPLLLGQIKALEFELENISSDYQKDLKKKNNQKKIKEIKQEYTQKSKDITEKLKFYQEIFQNTDKYEFALSNYYKYYYYTFVTFKYLDLLSGQLVSENSHIVKTVIRNGRIYEEKCNIIFVDYEAMKNKQPYQNKKVEAFLKSFTQKLDYGVQDLFFRKKEED